jgi:hypothetical protein
LFSVITTQTLAGSEPEMKSDRGVKLMRLLGPWAPKKGQVLETVVDSVDGKIVLQVFEKVVVSQREMSWLTIISASTGPGTGQHIGATRAG